jgi:hypothetical protein
LNHENVIPKLYLDFKGVTNQITDEKSVKKMFFFMRKGEREKKTFPYFRSFSVCQKVLKGKTENKKNGRGESIGDSMSWTGDD